MTEQVLLVIGIVGGTGHEGSGLAARWANAGYHVLLGSRSADRAEASAADLNALIGRQAIRGVANETAAREADIIVLTVPYAAQQQTAGAVRDGLDGKILIDVTVPLVPPKVATVQLPAAHSAAVALQSFLGTGVRVVSAFQNISAHHLRELGHPLECDVLVTGDDKEACEAVITLAQAAKMRAWYAGPLANAVAAEALTSVLITINRRYKVPGAGIRITGVPDAAPP